MAMTRKKRRIAMLAVGALLIGSATVLATVAFRDGMVFFVPPTELLATQPGPHQRLRVGGHVVEGSLVRGQGKEVRFRVTDNESEVEVVFAGILPDLFREGQSVVATGTLEGNTRFNAEEVLAKHDENYMPAEVADAIAKAKALEDARP
jgi:cytochrome c-type biogenesis protein CcmE